MKRKENLNRDTDTTLKLHFYIMSLWLLFVLLSRVKKSSPIFKLGITKEAIIEFTKTTPELAGKFKYSDDGNKIRLDTKKSKDAFLKLMNDSFLRSELTKQYYEASTKDNITQASN